MKEYKFAVKKVLPVLFSYIFIGIASGLLLRDAGYSFIWALLSGRFVYAGSMQIVMVPLLAAKTPIWLLAVMTLFINARHIFYGIGFIDEFKEIKKRCFWKYPYMILTVTDETYSILCSLDCPKEYDRLNVEFYILCTTHILWIVSCTLGSVIGNVIPFDTAGIDFSATAFFICIVVDQWKQFKSHIPAVTGAVSAAVFYFILGAESFLLPALSISALVLVLMKDKVRVKMMRGEVANE